MAYPLNEQEAQWIIKHRFGIRASAEPLKIDRGAAYALDEGQSRQIQQPYMTWDHHLFNTLLRIQSFEESSRGFLLFIAPAWGGSDRYTILESLGKGEKKTDLGMGDKMTFAKAHSVLNARILNYIQMDRSLSGLMDWVFAQIKSFGPNDVNQAVPLPGLTSNTTT